MSLREILTRMAAENTPVLLNDGSQDWEAGVLLGHLSEPFLKKSAHLQEGLYIAEINDAGYLGQVLYKIKARA
ncbi:hypothetical protein ACFL5L_04970 [candidate division KSB1 bacterium]